MNKFTEEITKTQMNPTSLAGARTSVRAFASQSVDPVFDEAPTLKNISR